MLRPPLWQRHGEKYLVLRGACLQDAMETLAEGLDVRLGWQAAQVRTLGAPGSRSGVEVTDARGQTIRADCAICTVGPAAIRICRVCGSGEAVGSGGAVFAFACATRGAAMLALLLWLCSLGYAHLAMLTWLCSLGLAPSALLTCPCLRHCCIPARCRCQYFNAARSVSIRRYHTGTQARCRALASGMRSRL